MQSYLEKLVDTLLACIFNLRIRERGKQHDELMKLYSAANVWTPAIIKRALYFEVAFWIRSKHLNHN